MAKYLKIERDTYRLPAETDLEKTGANLLKTFGDGAAVSIKVEMDDNPPNNARLIINGKTATHAALLETGDAEGDPPVLDISG